MSAPGNSNDIQKYSPSSATTYSPQELWHPRKIFIEELDVDIHTKYTSHNNEGAHHEGCCCQHYPHLQEMVLFVIQHYVDVVLCVIDIFPQLPQQKSQESIRESILACMKN